MADQTIPDYETIRAAVAGETWAVEKVLMCYKDEIDRQATVKKRQPDGTFKLEIDELPGCRLRGWRCGCSVPIRHDSSGVRWHLP